MAKVRDMTKGNPAGHIIAFAVPMLLGNVFQQMYSLVDTAIVGKICGVEALAAVGSAGWLDWLVLGFVIGLTQGFSILISQRFGAGDMQGMRRAEIRDILAALDHHAAALRDAHSGEHGSVLRDPAGIFAVRHAVAVVRQTELIGAAVRMIENRFNNRLKHR